MEDLSAVRSRPTDRRSADSLAADSLAIDALTRIVEGEILPRLMLAHRAAPRRAAGRRPEADEIARFAALLLAPEAADVAARVRALREGGLPLASLLLDLLAPAARHLGALWEEDVCDFVDVTRGLGRLQAVTRALCAELEDDTVRPQGRSVLLAPCPGETHVYALSLVASFFREAGWDVTEAEAGPDALARVRAGWFDVAGLGLACDVHLPAMPGAVAALRGASRNPGLRVLVGGALFARDPGAAHGTGADAAVPDGARAPEIAESLLEIRARAC